MKKIKNCEICDSKNLKHFRDLGRVGKPGEYGKLNICICFDCGHRFLNPRKSDNFFKKYYTKKYRKIAFGSFKPSNFYIKEQYKRSYGVMKYFKPKLKKGNFLDHGCASGATMLPWKETGWNVFGIDPHLPSVITGNNQFKLDIKHAFGEKMPFKKNFFETIMSLGSLEHSYDINKSLKEIYRVLKKKGKLIIRWRVDKIKGSPFEYYNHNHFRYFTKKTWRNILIKHGFKIKMFVSKKLEKYNTYSYILAQKENTSKKLIYDKNLYNELIIKNKIHDTNYLSFYNEFSKIKKINYDKLNKILKKYKKTNLNNHKEISFKRNILELTSFKKIRNKLNLNNASR